MAGSADDVFTLRRGATTVEVRPGRGAFVSRVIVDGTDLLYLDASTVGSPTGAVRGGIPLLFPFAGELAQGRLQISGTDMPRHGFGRRKQWDVTQASGASLTMGLAPDDEIRRQYPFAFAVTQTVEATVRGVRIDLAVANHDRRALPLAPGWHPYFPCPVDRTRACLEPLVPARDLPDVQPFECDVNVPAPAGQRVAFSLPDIGTVVLTFSENVRTLEIWTPAGAPFVCVEPWVGPSDTINTDARVMLEPGQTVTFWMTIDLSSQPHPEPPAR